MIPTRHTQPFLPALPPHLDGCPAPSLSELYGTGSRRERGQVPSSSLPIWGWVAHLCGTCLYLLRTERRSGLLLLRQWHIMMCRGKEVKSSITHLSSLKCHQISHLFLHGCATLCLHLMHFFLILSYSLKPRSSFKDYLKCFLLCHVFPTYMYAPPPLIYTCPSLNPCNGACNDHNEFMSSS